MGLIDGRLKVAQREKRDFTRNRENFCPVNYCRFDAIEIVYSNAETRPSLE